MNTAWYCIVCRSWAGQLRGGFPDSDGPLRGSLNPLDTVDKMLQKEIFLHCGTFSYDSRMF